MLLRSGDVVCIHVCGCVGWSVSFFFFFFQAEDGIRDLTVTGVQTCALPICIAACRRRLPFSPAPPARSIRSRRTRSKIGRATSELQSQSNLVCRLLLEKKNKNYI